MWVVSIMLVKLDQGLTSEISLMKCILLLELSLS